MLGFFLRLLPFWVREPLLIVIGSVIGLRLLHIAVLEKEWAPAGIGAVFLLLAAVSIHRVVRAVHARRGASAGAAEAGLPGQPQPVAARSAAPPVPPAAPAPPKEIHAGVQVFAAFAVFGVLAVSVWLGPRLLPPEGEGDGTPRAAACPSEEDAKGEKTPDAYKKADVVTGADLCEALNTPDLAGLLGTPGEIATTASGDNGTAALTGGKVARPVAEVRFDTYTVNVSVTYNKLSMDQYVKLMEFGNETDVRKSTVLDRTAVFFSQPTMAIEIDLGGGGTGGPVTDGPLARNLAVALDGKDRGGYCEVTVWSDAGTLPDDNALLDIAETVLPAIPERAA
ncbi:DUF6215 domain-containing protein [Streptomyces sp. SID8016]|uniref:DUF6215 domain-containing protein n=1 Tax=Streptomyces sp. SID8016 TaxID=2706098 RepID=UPI0013DBB360|nr:hypothetical protein [Streptomyces sp. SID8016]